MRIRTLLICLLMLPLLGLANAHAQSSASGASYSATVPVPDTSDAQRNHAFAVALGSILVRTSGRQITAAPGYSDALGSAASLVQDYQYQRAAAGASQPFVLKMAFDQAAVQLLAQKLDKQLAQAQPAPATSVPAPAAAAATVWVAPLGSAMDLARVLATVRANPQVTSAEPIGAESGGVMLRIDSSDGLPGLLSALQSGGHLVQSAGMHPGADASLRWVH